MGHHRLLPLRGAPRPVIDPLSSGADRHRCARLFHSARGSRPMKRIRIAVLAGSALATASCGSDPQERKFGPNPTLPEKQRGLFPSMTIADPAGWGDRRPVVPQGYTITPIASDLMTPRQTLVLPNGDILVAEGKGGAQAPAKIGRAHV